MTMQDTVGELGDAFDRFDDAETVDINLLIGGAIPGTDGVTHATKLVDIAEKRKTLLHLSHQDELM